MKKKVGKKKVRKKLSPEEKLILKSQRDQRSEITNILKNIGFNRLPYIDGKEFSYEDRTSEMDDVFINENVILILEYTIGDPGTHLLKKSIFYDKVLKDKRNFIEFMLKEEKLNSFQKYYTENIEDKYSINQLKLQILYCSKKTIALEHKKLIPEITFFDYHIVQYFKSLTRVIKKSSKYEFFEFIDIPFNEFSDNILNSSSSNKESYSGHILPEEKSKFNSGYKIVSFYIDAESLLRRAYVLRQEGWRERENVGYYQRMIDSRKVSSMRKYLTDKNRVFINNIISTISVENIRLIDNDSNEFKLNDAGQFVGANATTNVTPTHIEISDECNIIGLIDGQHRTYAYHEGDDSFEPKIANLRKIQNLLVTAILFPKQESRQNRLKFEANLFLEINSNQTNIKSQLKQEIELMVSPFSAIAIGKQILSGLNQSGPFSNLIEQYSFEKGKIKTASVVSFGLKPLIKLDDLRSNDSIFSIWSDENKYKLKEKDSDEYDLLNDYVKFSVSLIRDLLIAFKANLDSEKWSSYSPKTPKGILTITFVNGVLNVLRLLIENKMTASADEYKISLKKINEFNFKKFNSSHYRRMGQEIFDKYFKNGN